MKFAAPRQSAVQIYRIPLLLTVISGAGLVHALMAEGLADIWSSIAIALPLAAIAWGVVRRYRRSRSTAKQS